MRRVLLRREQPLFMTYLETNAMDGHYLEAEVILLAEPRDEVGGLS
jgi:hypothetical protein